MQGLTPSASSAEPVPIIAVFLAFLRLGLTSFGGPIAHLGYFRDEFVTRRQWLSERSYADLMALCHFLPGPTSSQVGMAIGLSRSGFGGALAAWAGFTLPSAVALIVFGLGVSTYHDVVPAGALHGLKVVAVAVVAQAVWGMAKNLCTGTARVTIAVFSACAVLMWEGAWVQVGVIGAGALTGLALFKPARQAAPDDPVFSLSRRTGVVSLAVFFVLLIGLPLLAEIWPNDTLAIVDAFYRVGSLVFGGGHVVLPLLQSEVVAGGWVDNDAFLAGYGAAQAVPGPLFTFAAFLGAVMHVGPSGWVGGAICLVAIFIPSFLLVAGVLPFWEQLRANTRTQAALAGINATVVGLLLAALYQPVWRSAVLSAQDFGLALLAFVALMFWRVPPWAVVLASGAAGWALSA
jgi:chromate transporter